MTFRIKTELSHGFLMGVASKAASPNSESVSNAADQAVCAIAPKSPNRTDRHVGVRPITRRSRLAGIGFSRRCAQSMTSEAARHRSPTVGHKVSESHIPKSPMDLFQITLPKKGYLAAILGGLGGAIASGMLGRAIGRSVEFDSLADAAVATLLVLILIVGGMAVGAGVLLAVRGHQRALRTGVLVIPVTVAAVFVFVVLQEIFDFLDYGWFFVAPPFLVPAVSRWLALLGSSE